MFAGSLLFVFDNCRILFWLNTEGNLLNMPITFCCKKVTANCQLCVYQYDIDLFLTISGFPIFKTFIYWSDFFVQFYMAEVNKLQWLIKHDKNVDPVFVKAKQYYQC